MPDSERAVLVAPSSPVPSIDGCQVDNSPSLMLRPSQKCTAILERKKVWFEAGVLTRWVHVYLIVIDIYPWELVSLILKLSDDIAFIVQLLGHFWESSVVMNSMMNIDIYNLIIYVSILCRLSNFVFWPTRMRLYRSFTITDLLWSKR